MPKRRFAGFLVAGAMLAMAFSVPGKFAQTAHKPAVMRAIYLNSGLHTNRQVQFESLFHAGGCHGGDGNFDSAYNPNDD